MSAHWMLLASQPVELTPARSQMGFTLAFHILLVPLGVVFPTLMLIANYKGVRHGDTASMRRLGPTSGGAGVRVDVRPGWRSEPGIEAATGAHRASRRR